MDSTKGFIDYFAICILVGWTFLWLHHLIAIFLSYKKLNRPLKARPEEDLPGISVLKPLMGSDSNLSANLETFFRINYPTYEILFCVENKTDPTAKIAASLIEKYPEVSARLVTGAPRLGINPKVNNLNSGYLAAQYDLMLISDSANNIQPDAPMDMVARMKGNIAVVHQMPFACSRPGFAAALEKVYLGTSIARHYLVLNHSVPFNCMAGMSCLIRRSVLDSCGGLSAIANYLAEDFYLADILWKKGWKTAISSFPVIQNAGSINILSLLSRFFRWAQLRTKAAPIIIILEPLCECFVVGPLACWAFDYFLCLKLSTIPVFLSVHVLVFLLLDWLLLRSVDRLRNPMSFRMFVLAWVARGFFHTFLILIATLFPIVKWGERRYRVAWGGRSYEIVKPRSIAPINLTRYKQFEKHSIYAPYKYTTSFVRSKLSNFQRQVADLEHYYKSSSR